MRRNTEKDFWLRVDIKNNEECWEWKGNFNNKGLPTLKYKGITFIASRLAYMLTFNIEKIPTSTKVYRTCDNKKCCNPNHMVLEPLKSFWEFIDKRGDDECWEWQGFRHHNYGKFAGRGENKRSWLAHRYAYTITYGEIPENMCVCHKCDNPPCCNPKHLFLGTNEENVYDRTRKDRSHCKITRAQAKEIQAIGNSLAEQYGVRPSTIGDIIAGKRTKI